jgi:hypothetical protein
MTLTVCFDALGTCFSLEVLVQALDELMGDKLRAAGSGPRMTIMDWVSEIVCNAYARRKLLFHRILYFDGLEYTQARVPS